MKGGKRNENQDIDIESEAEDSSSVSPDFRKILGKMGQILGSRLEASRNSGKLKQMKRLTKRRM